MAKKTKEEKEAEARFLYSDTDLDSIKKVKYEDLTKEEKKSYKESGGSLKKL